ncbi:MAG: alpha/beta hydrolase [Okeania sp. SIO3H1]|nr:alpha/beta hydrolase [Okeania sp. SIO3H1]
MKFSQMFLFLSLAVTLVISSVWVSFLPKKVQAMSTSQRPYAVFVNGYGNCCAWGMNDVQKSLQNMGAEIRYVSWDNFKDGGRQKNYISNEWQFVRDAEYFINNQLDSNRPLILIGHSYGGDALLSLAPRIKRRILFLGVIDPVAAEGLRKPIKDGRVPPNVDYFFNRWQRNPLNIDNLVPFDRFVSGAVQNCRAQTCDQQQQNIARRVDGSPIKVACSSWGVDCPGYEPWPGGSNGHKKKGLYHNLMPTDAYIQRQIIDRIPQLL